MTIHESVSIINNLSGFDRSNYCRLLAVLSEEGISESTTIRGFLLGLVLANNGYVRDVKLDGVVATAAGVLRKAQCIIAKPSTSTNDLGELNIRHNLQLIA